jgi:starch synthase
VRRRSLDIVFLSTEAVPFAKTGGLGDVCGALPTTLATLGNRVSLIMPAFRSIRASGLVIEPTDISLSVLINGRLVAARLLRSQLPNSNVDVYFIDQPQYYDRAGLYGDHDGDHRDNCERFAFFCRAALQAITRVAPQVDIVHCNDWQTGLVPAYMRYRFEEHAWMQRARSVMTVHNLAYQGRFWHYDMPLTGLGWDRFRSEGIEFYGNLNFLKAGIQLADMVTTVSPTYAEEIQQPLHGCGLDPILRSRVNRLRGIINGIDDGVWNPAIDPHLAMNYDVTSWRDGKSANKRYLQEQFGLATDPHVPLIGLVGRLADQKGWDLVIDAMQWNLEENRPVQWVVLGTGDIRYHDALASFASRYADRFGLKLGFSDPLAHQIEAGADLFLMPSRYEPCGLNQLYSLRYGTVPIVTSTGGLADTVIDASEDHLQDQTATGFHVNAFSAESIDHTLGKALAMRHHAPHIWASIVERGMRSDWTWRKSAQRYIDVYAEAIALND